MCHTLCCRRTTPDMVFYQCFQHKKLGWLIQVRHATGLDPHTPIFSGLVSCTSPVVKPFPFWMQPLVEASEH